MRSPELSGDEYLFLKAGLILIIEGRPQEEIQYVMESDIRAYTAQKQAEIAVFEGAAGYSPTMGVIGTVMGLIHVLSNMSDAEQLASAIAIAFVATLYGVSFANLIYMPMASKLKTILKRQKIQREMTVDGVCMIAEGLSTRTTKTGSPSTTKPSPATIKNIRKASKNKANKGDRRWEDGNRTKQKAKRIQNVGFLHMPI